MEIGDPAPWVKVRKGTIGTKLRVSRTLHLFPDVVHLGEADMSREEKDAARRSLQNTLEPVPIAPTLF